MNNARKRVKYINLSVLEGKKERGKPLYHSWRIVNFLIRYQVGPH